MVFDILAFELVSNWFNVCQSTVLGISDAMFDQFYNASMPVGYRHAYDLKNRPVAKQIEFEF